MNLLIIYKYEFINKYYQSISDKYSLVCTDSGNMFVNSRLDFAMPKSVNTTFEYKATVSVCTHKRDVQCTGVCWQERSTLVQCTYIYKVYMYADYTTHVVIKC